MDESCCCCCRLRRRLTAEEEVKYKIKELWPNGIQLTADADTLHEAATTEPNPYGPTYLELVRMQVLTFESCKLSGCDVRSAYCNHSLPFLHKIAYMWLVGCETSCAANSTVS